MKEIIERGATSVIRHVFIQNSGETDGSGLTALAHDTASLAGLYIRDGGTLATLTFETIAALGTYAAPTSNAHIRIKLLHDTNAPGMYELQFHNDWFNATGDKRTLTGMLFGAANMAALPFEFQLSDPVRGVGSPTALPNAAADAAHGLPVSDAGGLDLDTQLAHLDADITSRSDGTGVTLHGDYDAAKAAAQAGDNMNLADNAITDAKINADAITEAKIADDAIAAEHIAAAAIANATFAADVGSTAYATNIIALAVRKVLDELNLNHLLKDAESSDVTTDSVIGKLASTDGTWAGFVKSTDSQQAIRDKLTALNDITVANILAGTVDGTLDVQDCLKAITAFARGVVVISGNEYAFKDQAGATLFTLTISSAGRTVA